MITLGLVCLFYNEKFSYRATTFKAASQLSDFERKAKLLKIGSENVEILDRAIDLCIKHKIYSHRITSNLFPLATHATVGYKVSDLPEKIACRLREIGQKAKDAGIRLTFHPGQFCVLNSTSQGVIDASIEELMHHNDIAELVCADVINIHGGGGYGNKVLAIERLVHTVWELPETLKNRLTFENDEKVFSPDDIMQVWRATGVPMVYDVHHHRCHTDYDKMDIDRAISNAVHTWRNTDREPLFHISSPKDGWENPKTQNAHHDYISVDDFPNAWKSSERDIYVDVEAKHKELALIKLRDELKIYPTVNVR